MLESLMAAQPDLLLETLASGWHIFLVLVGLCMVIFVHELGHFFGARLVGIRVEAFAIGFGPRLFAFKRGQTEYSIRAIPFGGYVKMLGQEDVALDQERVQATREDPESFLAKSVAQRMLVVSGGVIMNVIFAALAFMLVFMHGLKQDAPVVGEVIGGTPAAEAGLQPGDVMKRINGEEVLHFGEVMVAIMFSDPRRPVDMELERDGKIVHATVRPEWNKKEGRLMIGVPPAGSLKINLPGGSAAGEEALRRDDVILQAGSVKPRVFADVANVLAEGRGRPVELRVQRVKKTEGKEQVKTFTVTKRAHLILLPEAATTRDAQDSAATGTESILGFQPRCTFISPLHYDPNQPDPNQVEPLDVVVRAANITDPTQAELIRYFSQRQGKQVELEVLRRGERKVVTLDVPEDRKVFEFFFIGQLGVDDENPVVADTVPGSPAHTLNIPRGARIVAADGQAVNGWFDFIDALDRHAGTDLTLHFRVGDQTVASMLRVPADKPWEPHVSYVVDMDPYPMQTIIKGKYPHDAVILGVRQTWYFIKMVYVTIQRMFIDRSVDVKQVGGPIFIMHAGKTIAEAGIYRVLYFFALISANLAVVNFLPLPLFDGGIIVLLAYEKIRGKPLSPRYSAIWQAVGLGLIILLFALLTYNDIVRITSEQ